MLDLGEIVKSKDCEEQEAKGKSLAKDYDYAEELFSPEDKDDV